MLVAVSEVVVVLFGVDLGLEKDFWKLTTLASPTSRVLNLNIRTVVKPKLLAKMMEKAEDVTVVRLSKTKTVGLGLYFPRRLPG